MLFYHFYELNHAAMSPVRAAVDMTRLYFQNPFNPVSYTQAGRTVAASCEMMERVTRRYGKPEFELYSTVVDGEEIKVSEEIIWSKPFCDILHFQRDLPEDRRADPKMLIVAPMSGHYATLLRGTVEALLPHLEIYMTDWEDARQVPVADGNFDLDDYIDYVIQILHFLGPNTHVLAVCQPSVPVFAAVALMEEKADQCAPATMTLMGGPIDTREGPTAVNDLAVEKGIDWFKRNVIMDVPFPHKGFGRQVYPGFLQLSGFMSMNLDRHMVAHRDFFQHLIEGDGDSAEKHRDFYDEYLAVMDLTAEFYLQTVETVFIEHALPKGELMHRGERVDPKKITGTALLTVEGENDDISGLGQTQAAQKLAENIPANRRMHYVQQGVGHYGVFNGSKYRAEIVPRIIKFIEDNASNARLQQAPKRTVKKASPTGFFKKLRSDPLRKILLSEPKGTADDLKQISGVGPKLEKALNGVGIFHYWQIASLTEDQAAALDDRLDTRGRLTRDSWVEQALRLNEEVHTN
ncbi:30S ribosomal protein S2 [Pseudovibrio axinellae]|uniref:30S ribosomal protein S2 n=1 Tax=Pseudovibrio axinellae TaxID=989403 RepID=A0A165Z3Q7_9HYPH|nr:polyhydroxyalkanoate depolymerase [Pseudovibrio axinellae]KZL19483.1 30S ribosomal protein S2 [Pseudovibrio axinellae]SEQ28680.1 poly(3-hydroxybutyrate) depolymerase [Pseudovibrio axinellae]